MNKLRNFLSLKSLLLLVIIFDSVIPLIVWPFGSDYFYYPKILIIYFAVLLGLIICYFSYSKRNIENKFPDELIWVIFFLVMILMSTIFSKYTEQALWGRPLRKEGALAFLSYFLILYFSFLSAREENNIKIIIRYFLISASIISVYAILQYIGFDPIPRDSIRKSWSFTSFATLGNPNFLGSYLSIALPVSMFLYLYDNNKIFPGLLFISSILIYSALLCAKSRSAWVGVIFSMIVMIALFFKPIIQKIGRLVVLLTTIVVVTIILNSVHNGTISAKFDSLISDYKTIISENKEKSTAGSERIFIWSRSMDYIFERPFLGSGPDTFEKVFKMSPEEAKYHFNSESVYVDKAHNDYLQIIITMGFPALLFYLIFLSIVIIKSFRNIRKNNYDIFTISLLSGIIAYVVQSFFNISVVSVAPLFWSVLGLLIAHNYNLNKLYINHGVI